MINKGNDKHEDADSLLQNTNSHSQFLYHAHTDKNCYRKDKNNIPPIYFVCQRYNTVQRALC